MRRIYSFIFVDLHWKLLSLALAFVLWFVGAIMSNPIQNDSFNIPLRLQNIEILVNEGLVLVNQDEIDELFSHVQVSIRALRHDLEILREASMAQQAAMVVPSIDFRAVDFDAVTNSDGALVIYLDVSVNLAAGYEHFSISPSVIPVEIDAYVQQIFPIAIDVVNDDDIAPGVELRPVRLVNSSVTVSGTRTNMQRVNSVRVAVDVMGIFADREIENLPLVVFDHYGVDITDLVELSVRETTATVSVWNIETVELHVDGLGEVATGFAVGEIVIEPDTIYVMGLLWRLESLQYVALEVDLDDARESFSREIDVTEWLPDNVLLRTGESPEVTIYVEIEPIERRVFTIPRGNVMIRGVDAIYQIMNDAPMIRVEVNGPRARLAELIDADIGLVLDLRNRPIGTHNVTLGVELPEGFSLALRAPALQVQIHEPAGDVEEYDEEYDDEDEYVYIPTESEPLADDEPDEDEYDDAEDDYDLENHLP